LTGLLSGGNLEAHVVRPSGADLDANVLYAKSVPLKLPEEADA